MNEPTTPYSLLLAARDGHSDAWMRFVHLYGPVVYRWTRRFGLQSADAADVMQDVMLSVSKDLVHFDPTRPAAKFRAWLWTITRRRIADNLRGRAAEDPIGSAILGVEDPDGDVDPPTDVNLDSQTILRRALALYRDRFESTTWNAFWATVVEGREPAEVAETLHISRWAVYKARARILQRLRTELAGLLNDQSP